MKQEECQAAPGQNAGVAAADEKIHKRLLGSKVR